MHKYEGYGKATHSFRVSMNNFATIKTLTERFKNLVIYFFKAVRRMSISCTEVSTHLYI